ncbi:MAG TPA: MFS transporter [Chryseosolibacter sp.]
METLTLPDNAKQKTLTTIQWKQLGSLAALYGSIMVGWIAYQNYQPRLLAQFRFTGFTYFLTAAQAVIVMITPLIAGRLGDRYRFEKGHRLPVISAGISFAAMVFMAVAFTLLGAPWDALRWALPVLIVCWLIAMSTFTSPALSTLELFTPVEKLPHAMAILTITANVVSSLEPVIVDIIDRLGAPVTFMLGGIAVFFSGYALKKHSLGLFKKNADRESEPEAGAPARSSYALILFAGLALGVATTILFNVLPALLQQKVGDLVAVDGKGMLVGILLLSAMLSWPVGKLAGTRGFARMFVISFIFTLIATLALLLTTSSLLSVILAALYAVSFTSLSVVGLPLAISRAAYAEKVFCVGIFFAGVAVPEGVWDLFLQGYNPAPGL